MIRQVFFSFHYNSDNWRAGQVRNIGVIEGNRPATDNDWESIKSQGDYAIRNWIDSQMKYRSCTVVLIGAATAGRKWINYEIEQSWRNKMGVLGINIYGLKDINGYTSNKGLNPFSGLTVWGINLANVVKVYDPAGYDSKEIYQNIATNISGWINEAIEIRNRFG